jgi:hypothetical protein
MGHMRGRILWLASVLTASIALAPAPVRGQGAEFPQPDVPLPFPIGHDRMDKGGLYVDGSWVMYRQTNPIKEQPIAFTGFQVFTNLNNVFFPGAFIGSHQLRLDAEDVAGPGTYQPGFRVGIGWRFENGAVIDFSYMNLQKAVYQHSASLVPPNGQFGTFQENTFLFSPVFNFPVEYAGPPDKVSAFFGIPGTPQGTAFGIWNGASEESIEFDQRTTEMQLTLRVPVYETECWRCYGLIGPRFFWIWERFKWRTVSLDVSGNAQPTDAAIYTNIVSNRMYGPHIGVGQDWYLGHRFACTLDLDGALYLDIVKERAKYELGLKDASPQSKRAITDYTVVPEARANFSLMWYPHEAIQIRVGYDVMAFFNSKASKTPVDFDYGSVAPPYSHVFRIFDGWNAGIGIIF